MKIKVNELRHAKVLPSAKLAEMSTHQYSGITIGDEKFKTTPKWHEYEKYLDIHFDEGESVEGDITKHYNKMCANCNGTCCKDLPTHNLRIYMSLPEIEKACTEYNLDAKDFIETYITVDGREFGVVEVNTESNCHFLTPTGCALNDHRPLWCKLWICEILQEKLGGIKNEYRSSQVSKK